MIMNAHNEDVVDQSYDKREPRAELLALLICPVSKGPLRYNQQTHELESVTAGIAFPIEKGIPVLIRAKARALR